MVTRPIICFPFIGDSHGGSYISSAILIRQLVDRGYTVKIVLHENGRFSEYLQERSIEHLVLPICHSRHSKGSRLQLIFFFITRNLISLYRFLKKNRITLVSHCNISPVWTPCHIDIGTLRFHRMCLLTRSNVKKIHHFFLLIT